MSNVAAFKARLTLESNEYIQGWKKVEAATSGSIGNVEKAIQRGLASWSKGVTKSIAGLFGIQMADTLVKSIDDALKNPIFDNAGANIAYAIGDGFAKTLESMPVAGTLGKWIGQGIGTVTDFIGLTSDASGAQEANQQASRAEAARNERKFAIGQKMTEDLQKQAELQAAIAADAEKNAQQQERLAKAQQELTQRMLAQGKSVTEIEAANKELAAGFPLSEQMAESAKKRAEMEQNIAKLQREQTERMTAQGRTVAEIEAANKELAAGFQLTEEVNVSNQRRVELAQKLLKLQEELNDRMLKEGATGPEILAAREKLRAAFEANVKAEDEAIARREQEKKAIEAAAEAERERNRLVLEAQKAQEAARAEAEKEARRREQEAQKAQEKALADAQRRAEMRAAAEERHQQSVESFMESLQDALDQRTMTEDELFQKKMDRLGLDEEEQEAARKLNEALQAASEKQVAMSANVEGISSAVGSIKMAGTTTGLDKLAKPAEATARATAETAELLRRSAKATTPV